mmetsp:Transcript_88680/g.159878  ORF Transcript_88680/g.159878 Transcript_88680/m.159878 type:complete len:120 (-) Transcript_88680:330-689(-)
MLGGAAAELEADGLLGVNPSGSELEPMGVLNASELGVNPPVGLDDTPWPSSINEGGLPPSLPENVSATGLANVTALALPGLAAAERPPCEGLGVARGTLAAGDAAASGLEEKPPDGGLD